MDLTNKNHIAMNQDIKRLNDINDTARGIYYELYDVLRNYEEDIKATMQGEEFYNSLKEKEQILSAWVDDMDSILGYYEE